MQTYIIAFSLCCQELLSLFHTAIRSLYILTLTLQILLLILGKLVVVLAIGLMDTVTAQKVLVDYHTQGQVTDEELHVIVTNLGRSTQPLKVGGAFSVVISWLWVLLLVVVLRYMGALLVVVLRL